MKSTVEHLSPTRVKLNVEVPFEELDQEFARAYKSLAQQVRIPGFRPGKAPAKLIEARVGRDAVLAQVVNDALPSKYSQAVAETETTPIGQPDIDLAELEYGKSVTFTAEVDVRPSIDLPDFSELSVEVEPVTVDDSAVDEQFESLRARFGTLTGVERPAETGDFVSIDLTATVDGVEVEEASTTGLSHEVGSGQLIDGLDEALVGMSSGESKTFPTTLVAGEHSGEAADVAVTVSSVKVRELPDVDDDFAQLASEFDTVDELRADLRERVARSKRMEQAGAISDAVVQKLLDTLDIPVPEKVAEAEAEGQMHQIVHAFDHDDEKVNEFLAQQDTTREEWEREARESAEKSVRTQLLLDAIAEDRSTDVGQEELTQHIIYQAQRYGMAPQEFIQQVQEAGQIGAIYADIRRNKALGEIVGLVSVTDTSGAPVDTKEFFGPQDETGEQDGAEEQNES